jgi:ACS family tartrate transporter-like MFS transporter
VTLRLIPFLFILYMLNILDRVNVGFARLQMLEDLNLSEAAYGLGSSIFYIGYFVFEVPSNLILKRTGARRWIARILISWGLISAAMMFVTGPWSFYALRFLLGVAEAGFFPGIILYLSYWFPARERARAVSRFMAASALSGIVGGPLSGAIMHFLDGNAGLAGWQWLFLLEGLPSAFMGVVVLWYLTDRPEQAHWLAPAERAWLVERMAEEEKSRKEAHHLTLLQTFAYPRVWLLCLLYSTAAMASNGYGLYAPQLIKEHFDPTRVPSFVSAVGQAGGLPGPWQVGWTAETALTTGVSKLQIGLLSAIPGVAAMIGMVLLGAHSDWRGERRWHIAVPALVSATGFVLVALAESHALVLIGLALAHMGVLSMLAPFWALSTSFLSGTAAAGGIAFINSVGNLGGFVGPNVIGQIKTTTGSFSGGLLFLAGALVFGAFLALCARHDRALEAPLEAGETPPEPERGQSQMDSIRR